MNIKYIFIKSIVALLLLLQVGKLHSQETDMSKLVYKLVNTHIDEFYAKIKQYTGDKEIREDGVYVDTLFHIYADTEIATVPKHRNAAIEYVSLITYNRNFKFKYDIPSYILEYELDTLRFGSIDRQIEQAKLIEGWKCDSLITNAICIEHEQFLEYRKRSREYPKQPVGIDSKKDRIVYMREYSKLNPTDYGIRVGYPAFFEYEGGLYAFCYVEHHSFKDHYGFYNQWMISLWKWDGDSWEKLNSIPIPY